jgi:hypothetical protein
MPNEEIQVQSLALEAWVRFYCAGGKLFRERPSVYTVPSLVIETASHRFFELELQTLERGKDDYLKIAVGEDEQFGDPDREKFFSPRRQEVTTFPPDCDLCEFSTVALKICLIRLWEDTSLLNTDPVTGFHSVQFDGALLIKSSDRSLLLFPNETVFMNLNLTMCERAIQAFLKRSHDMVFVCEALQRS